ncbi:DEAD-domain-containing protein [Xylaria acuta]|nr:DEAD-domain-containing protein [Xylaria acuta]
MAPSVKKRKTSRSETNQKNHGDDDSPQAQPQAQPQASSPPESATLDGEVEGPSTAETDAPRKTFKELGIIDSLCDACASLKYTHATPIQAKAIPEALAGRDIIGLAETGSGKTAAFVLPILQSLLERPSPLYALILAPTRELAQQIGQQVDALGATISVRSCTIVGGLDMVAQGIALSAKGKPHVVVATPGRLLDHLEKTKGFKLNSLKYLVIDEADRLLDMDFGPVLDKLLKFLPRERRTFLFSATMSSKVESLQRASLRDPVRVSVSSSKYQTVSTLKQVIHSSLTSNLLKVYLLNEFAGRSTIVFVRTVFEAQRLSILIRHLGFKGVPLHGQLSQAARLGALNKFKSNARDIMCCTDVAARGLDTSVDLVLNYDLPGDSKTYIHRVGRTARAGKSGQAISLITQYDIEVYKRIEAALKETLPEFPTERDEVMVFRQRTEEAQRHSRNEMKNLMDDRGNRGSVLSGRRTGQSAKRRRDNMDAEEG